MITPALTLDFTTAALSPLVTFSRALGTATRVNSSGLIESVAADVARFDFNPVTFACRGLLVEESKSNPLTYSSDFGNAAWQKVQMNAPSTDAYTAPDGTATADKITENTASAARYIFQASAVTAGTTYTGSYFVRAAERSTCQLTFSTTQFGPNQVANFNLATGTIGGNLTGGTATIQPFPDNWYRISFSVPCTTSGTAACILVMTTSPTATRLATYTGDGTSGFYAWGGQFEPGTLTSYIPTTTTALIRNADVATITGINFSGFWQATRGGVLVRALPSTVSGTRPLVQFDDASANNIIALRGNTTNPELYVRAGGTDQAQIDAGTIAANTAYSLTGWWQPDFCAARLDTSPRVEDLSATIPIVTQARLGSDGANYLNGHLASINYYDQFSGQIYTRRKNKAVFNVI